MDWSTLLSTSRYFANAAPLDAGKRPLSPFQLDTERIIYTSSFRRLQGKTQVYPLPRFDYLRTRLTHTNEVAFVGKIIAKNIGANLQAKHVPGANPDDFSDIVYSACLAHDVGNPPFGHIGEEAIRAWFSKRASDEVFKSVLEDESTKNDFLHFDGNAQGFRILTRLASWREEGGMRLTYATLGAFSKYPYPSQKSSEKKKKFGYLKADSDAASKVFSALGMGGPAGFSRHPLAYIVEAADDISYLTTDIDDAHRMRQLPFEECEKLFMGILHSGEYYDQARKLETDNRQDKISFLRSLTSAALIDAAVQTFLDHHDEILQGQFGNVSLIEKSKFSRNAKEIRQICRDKVYTELSKIQLEAAGFNVIMGLMDMFGEMIKSFILRGGIVEEMDMKDRNLYFLFPDELRGKMNHMSKYACMITLIDYISGLTDRFALDLFQRLAGHSTAIGKMG